MSFHFFFVPALDPGRAQQELNAFCTSHRVTAVERQWVADGERSYWALCLTVAEGPGPPPPELRSGRSATSGKVDYKQVLSPEEFARFAGLRQWRKSEAERAGLPLYSVFTNEQLAAFVRGDARTLEDLGRVPGVGASRLERFGAPVLSELTRSREAGSSDPSGPGAES